MERLSAALELRPMTEADLEAVAAIESRTYSTPWSQQVFTAELAAEGRTYRTAVLDGELIGYAGMMTVADEAHVTTLVVEGERRGARIGTRLLLDLVDQALAGGARSLTLEVRASNQAAQSLYHRFGMAPVGVRKRYYVDEDALIMWAHDIDGEAYRRRLEEIRRELR